jgi:hypothetical protein
MAAWSTLCSPVDSLLVTATIPVSPMSASSTGLAPTNGMTAASSISAEPMTSSRRRPIRSPHSAMTRVSANVPASAADSTRPIT